MTMLLQKLHTVYQVFIIVYGEQDEYMPCVGIRWFYAINLLSWFSFEDSLAQNNLFKHQESSKLW